MDCIWVLGFDNIFLKSKDFTPYPLLTRDLHTEKAQNSPMYNLALTSMNIHATICEPMHVGSHLLPLLANVFIPIYNKTAKAGEYLEEYRLIMARG